MHLQQNYAEDHLERRILDKILYEVIAMISHDNYYTQLYDPPCEFYSSRLLSLIRQFFLIPTRIN
jgi:hypothetical protein